MPPQALQARLDHQRLPKLLHPGNAKAQAILADGQANALNSDTRAACERAVTLIRGGETRNDALFQSLMKKP